MKIGGIKSGEIKAKEKAQAVRKTTLINSADASPREALELSPAGKRAMAEKGKIYRKLIRENLTPDLLKGPYKKQWTPDRPQSWGHCYVASEAYYHLMGGKTSGLEPYWVKHEGGTHHFLRDRKSGEIVDLTADQFHTPPPYERGRRFGWLTGEIPSRRAAILMERVRKSGV